MFEDAVVSYKRAGGEARFTDAITLHFAGVPVQDILAGHVRDGANAAYPNAKPATKNRQFIGPASAILNHAAERGHRPPIRVKRFPEKRVTRIAADREWLDAFMAEAEPEIAALALFMRTSGARISEALSLRWEDLHGRTARVRRTKTGDPHDYKPSLEALLLMRGLERHNEYVFRYRSIAKKWRATCNRAGIVNLGTHQAGRHTFATEMIVRHGIDVMTTAKLGGWASSRMLDRYAHPEGLEDVVDEVFATPKPKERKSE